MEDKKVGISFYLTVEQCKRAQKVIKKRRKALRKKGRNITADYNFSILVRHALKNTLSISRLRVPNNFPKGPKVMKGARVSPSMKEELITRCSLLSMTRKVGNEVDYSHLVRFALEREFEMERL